MILVMVAAILTTAAAARSTWSPCGLSMLSTITPIGERARGHRYAATAVWFVLGAVAGGATLGGLIALGAAAIGAFRPSLLVITLLAAVACAVAAGSDSGVAGGRHLPFHCRQVNERWLDQFRPWVYGAGFGWQIGTGLATYVKTAAVYLVVVLGALTGRPLVALALGVLFGLVRGAAVLLSRNVASASDLRLLHRHMAGLDASTARIVVVVQAFASVLFAGWSTVTAVRALHAAVPSGARIATNGGVGVMTVTTVAVSAVVLVGSALAIRAARGAPVGAGTVLDARDHTATSRLRAD